MERTELIWQTRDDMPQPTNPLQAITESYTRSPRDMSQWMFDAWIYGIVVGWDDASYEELSKKHNWSKENISYNKQLRQSYMELWNKFHNQ